MLQHTTTKEQNSEEKRCEKPAIVIAAFGSTKRGRAVFDRFHQKVIDRYGEYDVYWAYTSKIIRQKTGGAGLQDTLTHLRTSGYSRVAIVPLQVFPGVEYQRICDIAANFQDLKIVVGETLMHRWNFVKDVLAVVERDFLSTEEGVNLLALHGTPTTVDPVNTVYLGLEQLVMDKYDNVLAAALEGVPDHETVIARIIGGNKVAGHRRIRILPILLVAGMHVEQDLMGSESSWKNRLEEHGFSVECQRVEYLGESYFKSLASYPEIEEFYLHRLEHALHSVT